MNYIDAVLARSLALLRARETAMAGGEAETSPAGGAEEYAPSADASQTAAPFRAGLTGAQAAAYEAEAAETFAAARYAPEGLRAASLQGTLAPWGPGADAPALADAEDFSARLERDARRYDRGAEWYG